MANKKVLIVGSARESFGGVSSTIKLMERMPVWKDFSCRWLGTQIQRNYLWKLWYAVKSNFTAFFILWRYDIIHFHTVPDRICLIIQLPIFLLALLWHKRIIMHIHMGNQLRNHTQNALFLWHLRHADHIILLAKKWRQLFEESYPSITKPISVLYNSCESRPHSDYSNRDKTILMAAYFNDNKAPDVLLRAWKRIKEKYPAWHIYMLGNGEVERFRQMVVDMELQDCVHFTGYVTGEEKERFFSRASILAMCSYEEGFPMVVLEAWSYGISVITTPVGGLPDVIEEGRNCVTFPFGDDETLATNLSHLIDDGEHRRQMSEYSQHFVKEHFSAEHINEQLRCIYERL
jgi:glycosyltransferase involved in cell wall biosynthesis